MHGEETGLPRRGALGNITAAVMRLHSRQVCLITRPTRPACFSAPPLTHTPLPSRSLVKGDIKGQGDDDDKGWGRSDSSHSPPPPQATLPVLQPPPHTECNLPQPGSSGSEVGGDSSPGNSPLSNAITATGTEKPGLVFRTTASTQHR